VTGYAETTAVPGIGTVGYAAESVGSSAESTGAIDAFVLALYFTNSSCSVLFLLLLFSATLRCNAKGIGAESLNQKDKYIHY
jgi:hypothetical protein